MKLKIIILMSLILFTGIQGCKKESADTGSLIGSWTRTYSGEMYTVTLNADGTMTIINGTDVITGSFQLSGSTLTLNTIDCTEPGTYTCIVTKTTMTLTLISDNCFGRNFVAPGIWTRI